MFQFMGTKTIPGSVLYPLVTGGSIILSTIADVLVFKEVLSARHWTGIAFCLVGTVFFI